MRLFRLTTFITLFLIGFNSFQTVAQIVHMAQHTVDQLQLSDISPNQQIKNAHPKEHECTYCSHLKGHTANIIFETVSINLTFSNSPDLVTFTCPLQSKTTLISNSARAPPVLV